MASRQASSDEILLRYRTVTVKGGMKSAFSQRRWGGGEGSEAHHQHRMHQVLSFYRQTAWLLL